MTTATRKLAAIMFTDIVGYTALMGTDEDKALYILRKNRAIHEAAIKEYDGKLVKEMGDGNLVQFDSASNAVLCAIRIQEQAKLQFDSKLRIGIHLGDITFDHEDVFGDGVNIASRLQAIADPGGIYISESLERSIRSNKSLLLNIWGE